MKPSTVFRWALLLGLLLMASCSEQKEPRFNKKQTPEYPVERAITNTSGSTIEVVITGRTLEDVTFYRQDDPDATPHAYPIEDLSEADQEFILSLKRGGDVLPEPEDPRMEKVKYLRSEIDRHQSRLKDVDQQRHFAQTNSQKSAIDKEREEIVEEIDALKFRLYDLETDLGIRPTYSRPE